MWNKVTLSQNILLIYVYIHTCYICIHIYIFFSYHISVCSEGFLVGRSVASVGSLPSPLFPPFPPHGGNAGRIACRFQQTSAKRLRAAWGTSNKRQEKKEATSDDCDSTDSTEGLHAEDFPGATGPQKSCLSFWLNSNMMQYRSVLQSHWSSCMYLWDPSDRETYETWWNISQSIFTVELGSYNKTYAVTYWCLACSLRRHFIILKSMSLLSRPVKRNRPVTISKTVHPALHTSEKNGLGSTEKQDRDRGKKNQGLDSPTCITCQLLPITSNRCGSGTAKAGKTKEIRGPVACKN